MSSQPLVEQPVTGPTDLESRCDRLRPLHVPGTPLVLPNLWDVASARDVAAAGFPVLLAAPRDAVASRLVAQSNATHRHFREGGMVKVRTIRSTPSRWQVRSRAGRR